MPEINKVHTSCKNCVFAEYEANTQVGCFLNYIPVFHEQNIDIISAYDEDKEFYIVNGKQCIGYTKPESLEKHNLKNSAIDEIIAKYNELNKLNYMLIINTLHMSLNSLDALLNQIGSFEIKPRKIILIRYPDPNNKLIFYDIEQLLNRVGVKWKIVSAQTIDTDIQVLLDSILSIETRYRFVFYVSELTTNIEQWITTGNDIVHNKMGQFFFITNNSKSIFLFPATVYRYQKFVGDDLINNINYHTII